MSSILQTGISSVLASEYALAVFAQNITNADNPFYSRRDVMFTERYTQLLANGVNAPKIQRIFDDLVNANLVKSVSQFASAKRHYEDMKEFESYIGSDASDISHFMNQSLKALHDLNTNPTSIQSREFYLSELNNIINRFQSINTEINRKQILTRDSIIANAKTVNEILSKIDILNKKIEANGDELKPGNASLFDEREKLLHELGNSINFNAERKSNGVIEITTANGIPLISQSGISYLSVEPSNGFPEQMEVFVNYFGTKSNISNSVSGGTLGALLDFQTNNLNNSKKLLDRLAISFAQKLNEQNQLGVNLQGKLGGNIFNDINDVKAIKARIHGNIHNQGSMDAGVIITDAGDLKASDYTLVFDSSSHYQLIRKSDNQVINTGDILSFPTSIQADGFSINLQNGTFAAGDQYYINPTQSGSQNLQLTLKNPGDLALGFPVRAEGSLQNKGKGNIEVNAIFDTKNQTFSTPMQLNPPIRVEFTSSTTYRIINANDNSIIEDNLNYSPEIGSQIFPTPGGYDPGYRITLTGEMYEQDSFLIEYNSSPGGDNRNGLVLDALYQKGILQNGELTFSKAFQALKGDISIQTYSAKMVFDSASIVKNQLEFRRNEISGVTPKEETLNILKMQQVLEASMNIIHTAKSIFETIISVARS